MVVIDLEVAVATIRKSIVDEEGTHSHYLVLPRPAHHLPLLRAQDPLLQILAHPLQ